MKSIMPEKIFQLVHRYQWVLYVFILICCIVCIGVVLYTQYFKDQKIEIVFGITDSEEQDEYNELKSEFVSLFKNNIEYLQEQEIEVEKIRDNYDIVVTAYSYKENQENCTLDVAIPYMNINNEITLEYNQETKTEFKEKAEELLEQGATENTIYTVEYEAYVQNNILSLIIYSELKEGVKSQKRVVKTYNYNLVEKREVSLEEILEQKNISIDHANEKIKREIKEVQEHNQAIAEQGYILYERDYTSEIYEVKNTKEYFLGKDGMLYLVYSYGNNDYTGEMDIVIFK